MRHNRNGRVIVLAAASLLIAVTAEAQARVQAGGALTFTTAPHSTTDRYVAGTTWGGSALFGVAVSPQLVLEVEPSFAGEFADEYTYLPFPSSPVRVVRTRRDTFLTFQLRWKAGALEPVAGVSYFHSIGRTHARFVTGDRIYFDAQQSDNTLAFVAGVDAAVKVAPRFYFVPTFRFIARPTAVPVQGASTGAPVILRYGAGARITF